MMALKLIICDGYQFVRARIFLILWISLVLYLFYDTFIFYKNGRQFFYIRRILGLGLCVSRATATVLNLCGALVLIPQCKKLNQILYKILSKLWPELFFFWLEKAKSLHMTVAITFVICGVVHSISHFVNLWNFSRGFDEECPEINFASYRNENPFVLLLSMTCVTGTVMLLITLVMCATSLRIVRRRVYNVFWCAHQLYLPLMLLFLIHPLSGVLKQEVIDSNSLIPSHSNGWTSDNSTINTHKFTAIESKNWLWMSVPLTCFFIDLIWRIFSRNRTVVDIIEAHSMAGRTISLTLSSEERWVCRAGQFVVLQCPQVSLLEWHPFTVVKDPNSYQSDFMVWIRVKGDWTEALEKLLKDRGPGGVNILVDGPFSSPMECVSRDGVSICVAAGVGITPFVSVLYQMLRNPRSRLPARVHLLWIVRHEQELTWLAELANETIARLRDANCPDRLHLQLYVTQHNDHNRMAHTIVFNGSGRLTHLLDHDEERATLLTPKLNRNKRNESLLENYDIAKNYPLLGCRVRRGRPHWDGVFGYWVHLYPRGHLNLFCCGPKKLVKLLRNNCEATSRNTKTKINFVHEGFS